MDKMELKALGKINLGLDVLGRRENGYHDVRMVMQTVYLYDQIVITKTKQPGVKAETNLFYLPVDENNLACRAAKMLIDEFNITEGVHISMDKKIPVSAGMAGGSADAAAVLFGVNKMFGLGLSMTELEERGVKLGADVPYCLMRGTALAEGIGEKLTPLPAPPQAFVLIAKPSVSVSTKFVYENLHADSLASHPDVDGMIQAMKNGDYRGMTSRMENVLETVTIPNYPVINRIRQHMLGCGADGALMSGSGPTVFGLFSDQRSARRAYNSMLNSRLAKQVYLTGFFQPGV